MRGTGCSLMRPAYWRGGCGAFVDGLGVVVVVVVVVLSVSLGFGGIVEYKRGRKRHGWWEVGAARARSARRHETDGAFIVACGDVVNGVGRWREQVPDDSSEGESEYCVSVSGLASLRRAGLTSAGQGSSLLAAK